MAQMSSTGGGFKSYVSLTSRPQLWSYCTKRTCMCPSCLTQALTHFQPSCNLIAPYLGLVKALGFIWAHWFPMFTAGFLQCEQQSLWRSCAERIVLWKKWPFLLFPNQGSCLFKAYVVFQDDKMTFPLYTWKWLFCHHLLSCCPKSECSYICMYVFIHSWNTKGEILNEMHAAISASHNSLKD